MARQLTILHLRFHGVGFETYGEVLQTLGDITPAVQALPPDSALADITGALTYFKTTPAELADRIQTRIAARFGITVSAGGGPSRMIATIAADTVPTGQALIVPADQDAVTDFLDRQPVTALPGIGPALGAKFHRYGVHTVGALRMLPPATVQRIAGRSTGLLLAQRADGHDPRTITPAGPPASVTAKRSFDHDVLDPAEANRALLALAVELGARLRHDHQVTRQIELQITYADRTRTTRTRTLTEPTGQTTVLQETLYAMFGALRLERARIRTLTARAGGLGSAGDVYVQLTLDKSTEDARRLQPAIDKANRRFGQASVLPGSLTTCAATAPRLRR
ncbi:hypothetical protein OHV05_35285 (plasmid) [Kitasatospora sp. NBC_00070]|uniref:DNA polymerase Y family protein n=1 Tax=Kitasatospora sp. NBC_00070 TaxID=2975962 RepID=UPI002F91853E